MRRILQGLIDLCGTCKPKTSCVSCHSSYAGSFPPTAMYQLSTLLQSHMEVERGSLQDCYLPYSVPSELQVLFTRLPERNLRLKYHKGDT